MSIFCVFPLQGKQKMVKTIDATFLTLKMLHSSVLYDSVKTTCLAKIRFFIHGLKRSQPIRLQHSLIVNIFMICQFFCMKLVIKSSQYPRLLLRVFQIALGRNGKFCWGGSFLSGGGNLTRNDFYHFNLFQSQKQH